MPGRHSTNRNQPPAPATGGTVRFGDCELQIPTRELWRQRQLQPVPKRVFDLMAYLIARRPAAASHREIAQAVWGRPDVRHTAIAQAMLQARRLTGDDLDEPVHFVTVRGVGYRFAGKLKLGVVAGSGAGAGTGADAGSDLAELRQAVDEARAAADRSDQDAALFLGERAIALAERMGANALKARAMATASWAALHKGTMDLAARYAYEALRLAEAEDHHAAAADARVRVAHVLFAGGDLYGALQMLEAVRIPGDVAADDPVALRCAALGTVICGDLQRFDEARVWSERAQQTSLQCQPTQRAIRERLSAVNLCLKEAEAAEAMGQPAQERESFKQALTLNEQLRVDIDEIGNDIQRMCWFGNQGIALTGLGRLDEAWPCAEQAKRLLEAWPNKGSPWYLTHLGELRLQWAVMFHKVSRHTEALEQIEPAMACAESGGRHAQAARLATLAAKVCEATRRFQAALQWMRRAQAAQHRLQLERAARLATAYRASRDHDHLHEELRATRARLTAAQAQIQQLAERVLTLERSGPVSVDGLLPAAAFELALRQRYDDAQTRDLPCLVCVLRVEPRQYSAAWDSADARQALFRLSAAVIRVQFGAVATLICAWSDGALAFTVEGIGARRAGTICKAVEQGLAESTGQDAAALGAWSFQSAVLDLCRHDGIEPALQALRRAHPPGAVTALVPAARRVAVGT